MIRNSWHVLWLALAIVLVSLIILRGAGVVPGLGSYLLNLQIYVFTTALILGIHLLVLLWRERPESPIRFSAKLFQKNKPAAMRALPLMLAVAVFMPTFSAMKSAIPLFNEFTWDQTFIEWDAAIHGIDPWRAMQPVLGFPIITAFLALAYQVWVLLIYAGSVFVAFYVRDQQLVLRYFTAFILIWTLLGLILATALASVGPVFLEPILGDQRFTSQIEYLQKANETVPVMVLPVQNELLASYQSGLRGLGRGISAMPSMHVALVFLFWLVARRINRVFGRLMFGFTLIVMIGSVHLAYHYAVDGYVSIILTGLIWKVSSILVRATAQPEGDFPAFRQVSPRKWRESQPNEY